MKPINSFKLFSVSLVSLWLTLLALLPFLFILIASLLSPDEDHFLKLPFTLNSYHTVLSPLYFQVFERSLYLAGVCTLLCLFLGYPFAYILARLHTAWKGFLLLLVIIPFWTSSLIRCYAIMALLKGKGLINGFLLWAGIISKPLPLLYTNTAVIICLVYNLLPFMIFPLYSSLVRLDIQLLQAARDLGANTFTTFRRIVIPLTLPGILAGSILVFLPAMTLFFIPDLLGGAKSLLIGNLIEEQFLYANNWPVGSAASVILTVIMALLLWIYWQQAAHHSGKQRGFL
jgi:spermidine/putrescine transport system permease protein